MYSSVFSNWSPPAADLALEDGFEQDAQEMRQMTPHSIRHTGITHDINLNGRPLSHVQADAGHDSIDTTSQYLHVSKTERHETAARKQINRLSGIEWFHFVDQQRRLAALLVSILEV